MNILLRVFLSLTVIGLVGMLSTLANSKYSPRTILVVKGALGLFLLGLVGAALTAVWQ